MRDIKLDTCKVALITGGWSDEKEISRASGQACAQALQDAGFINIDVIDISDSCATIQLAQGNYDVAFIAMHGQYGEDGCIQGLCEILHIPYTFSGVLASAMATEKNIAKQVYKEAGIPVPEGIEISASKKCSLEELHSLVERLGLPIFVKPACNGSSFGVTKVTKEDQLQDAITKAQSSGSSALIEQCIEGTEITVPVLGNEDPQALPIIEVVTGADFYDLKVKYEDPSKHHVIPARLDEDIYKKAQEYAVIAHKALGCAGASRSDFIVTADGEPVILETNTIPGMTETSLLPDSARHAGIEFPELCRRLIELAFERFEA
ncbi:MAG TPA: D-alanine--D-alanine ligase [Candidatus Coprovicinus avistercoris]|uniref:D-alanine--D-alanine ligase n=1 Tax=Candidatus Coprovicinus avistercoris TaxID=2840754 RepID=A0A9D1HWW9_9ACTN|nr:D-alanine--D-alanine ligase [Candidatus Coprovicinus avistercoris]